MPANMRKAGRRYDKGGSNGKGRFETDDAIKTDATNVKNKVKSKVKNVKDSITSGISNIKQSAKNFAGDFKPTKGKSRYFKKPTWESPTVTDFSAIKDDVVTVGKNVKGKLKKWFGRKQYGGNVQGIGKWGGKDVPGMYNGDPKRDGLV